MTTTLPTPDDTSSEGPTARPAASSRISQSAQAAPVSRPSAISAIRRGSATATLIRRPGTPPGPRQSVAPRPVVRLRRSRPDLLLCLVILAAILLVQGWNITRFPTLSDDEGTYLAQAWAVQQGRGLAHYSYWYDHPPVGWIQLAGFTYLPSLIAPETMNVATMRLVMLLVSGASAVFVYVLARRLTLPRWAAGTAMALSGLSPLAVVYQRQIFLDNLAVMWTLLAFCLAASPRRHLWHQFMAGVAAAVGVLTKETMLVVLPALFLTLWRGSHRDTRKFAVTGAVTACVLVGLSYPVYALLKGELFSGAGHVSLMDGIVYQLGREGSGFILDPGTGSNDSLESWLYYDPVLPLGGLAASLLLLALARWSGTARALAGPVCAVLILALVALRPDGYLPAMYVLQLLPFLALALAGLTVLVGRVVVGGRPARPGYRPRPSWRTRLTPARTVPSRPRRTSLVTESPGTTARIRTARRAMAAMLALAATAFVVPVWVDGNRDALTTDVNRHYRGAAAWLEREVPDPATTRVLVDDALWLDLVHDGFTPGTGVIWFYKADRDPAVVRSLPRGWRDIDYVVSSQTVRRDSVQLPTVRQALENSTPVAAFGTGDDRVEIRRVTEDGDVGAGAPR
ncbi:ArnT family glycosyltransferase [Streptomyces sp. NPDC057638]|uniref:ArnT family glycosyltransferase n=1 Tax=Streptomyces sp. NPDC057638 TaxID=3346190 RepID=UPI0036CAFFB6